MPLEIVRPAPRQDPPKKKGLQNVDTAPTGYRRLRNTADEALSGWGRPLNALQGAGMGWADEALGEVARGATIGTNALRGMFGRGPLPVSPKDARDAVRDAVNNAAISYAKRGTAQAIDAAALQMAGGLVTGSAGGKFMQGATTLPKAMRNAGLVGAAYGSVAGAGGANDSERISGAVRGAAIGGATGAALPLVARGAQVAGRAVNNTLFGQRLGGGPEGAAAGRMRQALMADGVDEASINQALAEYQRTGAMPPAFLDVAGENTRALIRAAGSRPGEARNLAQTYKGEVLEAIPDASIVRANQLTPNETRPAAVVQSAIQEARDAAASTNYAPAYATPVQVDDSVLVALQGDAGRAALQRARTAAAARRDMQQLAEIDALLHANDTGTPLTRTVSGGTLDRIRIAMQERGQTAMRRGARDIASGLNSRAGDLNSALDNIPEMRPARAAFRQSSEAMDAIDIGQRILRETPDNFAASLIPENPQAMEAARVGARQALADALGQRASAASVLQQIAMAPNTKRNLEALFGPDEAERLITAARLNLERGANASFIAPNTGAQTQLRLADQEAVGNVLDVVRSPIQAIMTKFASGLTLTDQEAAALVRLGRMTPEQAMAAMRPRIPVATTQAGGGAITASTANYLARQ